VPPLPFDRALYTAKNKLTIGYFEFDGYFDPGMLLFLESIFGNCFSCSAGVLPRSAGSGEDA
jgi:hypothetical protein